MGIKIFGDTQSLSMVHVISHFIGLSLPHKFHWPLLNFHLFTRQKFLLFFSHLKSVILYFSVEQTSVCVCNYDRTQSAISFVKPSRFYSMCYIICNSIWLTNIASVYSCDHSYLLEVIILQSLDHSILCTL